MSQRHAEQCVEYAHKVSRRDRQRKCIAIVYLDEWHVACADDKIHLLIDPYRRKKLGVGLMASLKLFRPEQALELIYLITTGYADLVNAEYFIIGKSRA